MAKYSRCVIQVQRTVPGGVSRTYGLVRHPTKGGAKRAMKAAIVSVRSHRGQGAEIVLLCPNKPERVVFRCEASRRYLPGGTRGRAVVCKPIRSHGAVYKALAKGAAGVMDRGKRGRRTR